MFQNKNNEISTILGLIHSNNNINNNINNKIEELQNKIKELQNKIKGLLQTQATLCRFFY